MKPFDLEKALAGEPVKLRNGWKAYVKYVFPDEYYKESYPLRGFCIKLDNKACEVCWTMEGKDMVDQTPSALDIIEMWEEPRPRVQLDLPCPLKEPQEGMCLLGLRGVESSCYSVDIHDSWMNVNEDILEDGRFFATKEDAEEWINAMKGARK